MRVRGEIVATVILSLALPAVVQTAAEAGNNFTISVPDPTVKLKETFTVNGSDAPCPNAPYTVNFSYTTHDGGQAVQQANGSTDPDRQFSQVVTVPEAATPGQPASVSATVTCVTSSPSGEAMRQGTGGTSNTVAITIEVATGVLGTDTSQGRAGTLVRVSGTNCLGDDVVVVFGNANGADEVDVVLLPDDTFSGTYPIPNVPPGTYFFAAACPGTDYADRSFTVLPTPGASPTPLPPAVPREVDFTG
jgi:hypothetical protein